MGAAPVASKEDTIAKMQGVVASKEDRIAEDCRVGEGESCFQHMGSDQNGPAGKVMQED